MHLFDINVPGKMVFKESEILSPGNNLFTFQVGKDPLLFLIYFFVYKFHFLSKSTVAYSYLRLSFE